MFLGLYDLREQSIRSCLNQFLEAHYGQLTTSSPLRVSLTFGFSWLDETPTARIITRFTQDIQSIDSTLPEEFFGLTAQSLYLITSLAVVLIFTPFFVAPALVIAAIGFYLGSHYLKAQLGVTREKRYPFLALLWPTNPE